MEETKKKESNRIQKFYFTDEGEFVVESNKGVWVDGKQYVKMYGNFQCNARTMGEIISKLKNIPVKSGVEKIVEYQTEHTLNNILNIRESTVEEFCILGVDDNEISRYYEKLHEEETAPLFKKIGEYAKIIEEKKTQIKNINKKIEDYNNLPWIKRIFRKIK